MKSSYDFSGWATKNNVKCSDGRTIRQDAFADCDGKTVPLVWQHQHDSIENVLGHAVLENRKDGVYAYGKFNDTYMGKNAKELLIHGDITSLSIFANQLKQEGGNVIHGNIRELSLVLAGANPEALIENVNLAHSDGGEAIEAIIFAEESIDVVHGTKEDDTDDINKKDPEDEDETEGNENAKEEDAEDKKDDEEIAHSDEGEKKMEDKTIKDVLDSMTEEQRNATMYLISEALKENSMEHSDEEEEMKKNVFDGETEEKNVLSHEAEGEIIGDAKRFGSLKESFLAHAEEYGIDNIDYLFPDYKSLNTPPEFIKRDMDWVQEVMGKVKHTPFARIKSMFANITEDEARAKGYVKGNLKMEEVFGLLKRVTDPQTVYKKQKLDRDDILDITDFDVVAWLKKEMRMMLDEELARAILIGDGRSSLSADKISPEHIRPIWTDSELYTVSKVVNYASSDTDDAKAKKFIRGSLKARKDYKGSGNPVLFTTEDLLTDMLLIEDVNGRVIYDTVDKLTTALRVSKIVTVPVMENQTRTVSGTTRTLAGIFVNLNDYNVGADKGGAVSMFDDFDIDYNQEKYLIETRCSGALIKPYSAIVVETVTA